MSNLSVLYASLSASLRMHNFPLKLFRAIKVEEDEKLLKKDPISYQPKKDQEYKNLFRGH